VAVGYDDFSLNVRNAGKEHAAQNIQEILQKIRKRKRDDVAGDLALPGQETWKFSAALPAPLVKEMALADYYRFPEFFSDFSSADLLIDESP